MIKIHLGCGKRNFGKGWIHIDAVDYPHISCNSVFPLPFDDGVADLIYASHLFEYFDREEALSVLKEWRRVIKPGGILRLAVPDFNVISKLYTEDLYQIDTFLGPLYGKMQMNDEIIYHKTCYDFRSLKDVLRCAGFVKIQRYDYRETEHASVDDHSQAFLPHMNKDSGVLISLNVEAIK